MQRSSSQNGGADLDAGLPETQRADPGLAAISLIAGYYRVAADAAQLRHQLALTGRLAGAEDVVRAARLLDLKARIIRGVAGNRLGAIPYPAILELKDGGFAVLSVASEKGKLRLVDPIAWSAREITLDEAEALSSGSAILVTRRLGRWKAMLMSSRTARWSGSQRGRALRPSLGLAVRSGEDGLGQIDADQARPA